jgi:hypothetical protein
VVLAAHVRCADCAVLVLPLPLPLLLLLLSCS